MNPFSSSRWLPLVAAFLVGGFVCGAFIDAIRLAQIANLKAGHATQEAAADRAALDRWQAAQVRADAAETKLAQADAFRQKTLQEKTHELPALTTGRACLAGPAVRLLNGPGLNGRLPETASQPAAAAAAFASDTDVAGWIAVAQDAYGRCIDTRQALIDWVPHD